MGWWRRGLLCLFQSHRNENSLFEMDSSESVFANTRHSQSSLAPVWHIIRDTERVQLSLNPVFFGLKLIALAWQEELSQGEEPILVWVSSGIQNSCWRAPGKLSIGTEWKDVKALSLKFLEHGLACSISISWKGWADWNAYHPQHKSRPQNWTKLRKSTDYERAALRLDNQRLTHSRSPLSGFKWVGEIPVMNSKP